MSFRRKKCATQSGLVAKLTDDGWNDLFEGLEPLLCEALLIKCELIAEDFFAYLALESGE
jgi:hypothetical protein